MSTQHSKSPIYYGGKGYGSSINFVVGPRALLAHTRGGVGFKAAARLQVRPHPGLQGRGGGKGRKRGCRLRGTTLGNKGGKKGWPRGEGKDEGDARSQGVCDRCGG